MQIKLLMAIVLALLVLFLTWILMRRHRCAASGLNFDDLLLGDDGKLSKAAAVMMGAFVCTTWLMVYLALVGKMTEGYLIAYLGAWVAPTVTKLITGRPISAVAITETSTVSTSKTAMPTGG